MKPATPKKPRQFTGYHAAAIIVSFFGVVIAVNLVMANFAISTFGGTVVDNTYVASQEYNNWLEKAREQEAHGWQLSEPARVNEKLALTISDSMGNPLGQAKVTALIEHPVGKTESFNFDFVEAQPGQYQSVKPLPAGRWKLKITVNQGGRDFRLLSEIK